MKLKILTIISAFALTSCISVNVTENRGTTPETVSEKPKNIILLIGDGMGLSQVSASFYYNKEKTNFERFREIGLIKTSASSDTITDSAASATAYATGEKTYNGAIGVKNDTTAARTIVEILSEKNIATGLVATSSIVHATPASFFAHVRYRSMYEEIAEALPASDIDFFAGGGLQFFNKRTDEKDLLSSLISNGFDLHTEELPTLLSEKKQAILLAENGMPKILEGRGDFLPNATKLAIEHLSKNEDGFFLLVEGSQIDWGGHSNDADYLITEQLDFDKTIGVALDYAEKNGNTLVIVTADHETGGFTLAAKDGNYNEIVPSFSTGNHSTTLIPVFAKGPGDTLFNGIFDNTALFFKMMSFY
ncbi:alkaline phosphatase [Jejudonia soesokkakensis]|uniref:Alkaline phosphatase n=1 Tax=Jejudonia soesokkakensis TaxID=1323432 RepID=A0ABW2MRW8_9FLAO